MYRDPLQVGAQHHPFANQEVPVVHDVVSANRDAVSADHARISRLPIRLWGDPLRFLLFKNCLTRSPPHFVVVASVIEVARLSRTFFFFLRFSPKAFIQLQRQVTAIPEKTLLLAFFLIQRQRQVTAIPERKLLTLFLVQRQHQLFQPTSLGKRKHNNGSTQRGRTE